MVRLQTLLLLAFAIPLLSGCGIVKKSLAGRPSPKKERNDAGVVRETVVGVIESVNPEQQFVLVRMEQRMNIAAGTRLETRSPNGMHSQLVAGPERKLNFLAADIVDGAPHAGDLVVVSTTPVGAPGGTPSEPGKKDDRTGPILTSQPPSSSPEIPPGDPVPGVPPSDPVPGVPPPFYSSPPPLPPQR